MKSIEPWLLALLLIFCIFQLSRLHSRIGRLETQLDALLRHFKVAAEGRFEEPSEQVKALARDPKTQIETIKAYREQTGLGLKEAKEVVDGLRQGAASSSDPKR
ncbi:ribosomal protein L7/L12 [Paucibacter oligotrophus]|uniref:Ribosomal protein L7/L12 n=1 Tax=Roseateles oligotrophus TaxID=1769250 RepID=A0A840L7X3_9BURK|nr:ribosomal protein L7/L12 [Roseateles oligotrophus]MBB4844664.1 ribosomal protein L7/L12 [Roseateles oligotrophus]